MSYVNFSTKEITSKIVYYGPGLCGKTTTLQYIYDSIVPENKGQMVSLATDVDRTIYFDFLPLRLGKIQSFSVRVQLYTVPGQVRYNSTRKLVLSGTDGVVFVADSQRDLMAENVKSYKNLIENLREHGLSLQTLPHILQYNKRDLPRLSLVEELNRAFNHHDTPYFETCATTGEGVLDGLKTISKLVMQDLNRKGVISQKRSLTYGGRHRTDMILRPLVGLADLDAARGIVVEEFDEPAATEPPAGEGSPARPSEPRGVAPSGRRRPGPAEPLSFSQLAPDPEVARRITALEEKLHGGSAIEIQKQAKDLFYVLIEDERHFPPDMAESARISMMGISLRKYAHFYRLLSQPTLNHREGLFLLHFLVDVQLGKGMP